MTALDGFRSLFPMHNRAVAEHLFVLEVGLRELIIDTLSAIDGPKWFKTLLPPDVTHKYIRGRQSERAARWSSHVEHHPLYYIDFPDLAKVLEKNWKATFQDLFADKSVLIGNLKSLEPIRNKLAHNRKVSEQDRTIVEGVLAAFESAVGHDRLVALVHNCSDAPSIPQIINDLIVDVTASRDVMSTLAAPILLIRWPEVKDAWWFDSTFLLANNYASKLDIVQAKAAELRTALEQAEREVQTLTSLAGQSAHSSAQDVVAPVKSYFDLYEVFSQQPRARGTGHKLESWRDRNDIPAAAESALASLNALESGALS